MLLITNVLSYKLNGTLLFCCAVCSSPAITKPKFGKRSAKIAPMPCAVGNVQSFCNSAAMAIVLTHLTPAYLLESSEPQQRFAWWCSTSQMRQLPHKRLPPAPTAEIAGNARQTSVVTPAIISFGRAVCSTALTKARSFQALMMTRSIIGTFGSA